MKTDEIQIRTLPGWPMLFFLLGLEVAIFFLLLWQGIKHQSILIMVGCVIWTIGWIILSFGFFTLQPNIAAVLVLFGDYKGTVKKNGFWWANPLLSKRRG